MTEMRAGFVNWNNVDWNSRKPTVPDVLPLMLDYYAIPGNAVGGHLHIVLSDQNVQDNHVQFCLDEARKDGDEPGVRLAELLLRMSKTQRLKLSRLAPG